MAKEEKARIAGPPTIYTIGHSTLPLGDFVALLHTYGITVLADIRTVPRSRTNPQYNTETLGLSLAVAGIHSVHLARLGGLRGRRKDLPSGVSPNDGWHNTSFRNYADYAMTPPFREGLDELLALAVAPTAIMCAEAVWWRCHRRIVADYLIVRGVSVLDIVPPAPAKPHALTPFARPQPDGTILYPAI
ncbi:MAG TPA: DUF488 domain-containing protein [Thermomicrobiales bacterium]